jgi:uncharacterized protein
MNQAIQDFMAAQRIAVVGVSRSGKKFGNTISTELKQRGKQIFLVHPEAKEINGERCYASLAELKGQVDAVVVCVSPQQAGQVIREAGAAGLKNVWLQMGAESSAVLQAAKEVGITPVTGKCILMYVEPVNSIHGWHRGFAKLFGQY